MTVIRWSVRYLVEGEMQNDQPDSDFYIKDKLPPPKKLHVKGQ